MQLSGLQHFSFCRRQWALIHIEQQWHDNHLTAQGNIVHERCHDEEFTEKRQNLLISRGLRLASPQLGVTGQCDVVEFRRAKQGCGLFGRAGMWQVRPVEYKRGQPKRGNCDRLQLCAQAMCLEEMFACEIKSGDLFYDEPHRREAVDFDAGLRSEVVAMLTEMHDYYRRDYTPKVKTSRKCQSCSLQELCIPRLCRNISVQEYYRAALEED